MASIRRRKWKTAKGEAKAAWVVDYTDSRGDRQRKHYLSKKAADAFRIQIEGQMQSGTFRPNADKVTVREVCDSFLEHCTARHERDERMTRKMLTVYRGPREQPHSPPRPRVRQSEAIATYGAIRGRISRPAPRRRCKNCDYQKDIGNTAQRARIRNRPRLDRNQRGPWNKGHRPAK